MQDLKLELSGTLSGVAFTKANEFINKDGEVIKYGSSLKLNFTYAQKVIKEDIETIESHTFTVKVPLSDTQDLKHEVGKYNKMIGQNLTLELINFDKIDEKYFITQSNYIKKAS